MATELLRVPEEHLWDVIGIIRAGLAHLPHPIHPDIREALEDWCDDEENYLLEDD